MAGTPDAEFPDHGRMGAAQHAHDFAVGLSIALDAGNSCDHLVAMHRAGSGFLRDVDVAAQARYGRRGNHEAVAVAVDVQAPDGEFAADAGGRVVPGSRFDQVPALRQVGQLGFQLRSCDPLTRLLPQQLLERRPAVRELPNMLDQRLRHVPLYWCRWS